MLVKPWSNVSNLPDKLFDKLSLVGRLLLVTFASVTSESDEYSNVNCELRLFPSSLLQSSRFRSAIAVHLNKSANRCSLADK